MIVKKLDWRNERGDVKEEMTTSPYSLDLRKRVINFTKSGNSQVSASKIFALNLSTVNR